MSSTLISSLILLTSFIQTSNGQCESNFDCYPDISAPDLVNCSTATKSCVCSGCFEHQGGKCQVTNGCWKLNSEGTACEDLSDQIQYFPLLLSLYVTAGLSVVLLVLSVSLMWYTLKDPERVDILSWKVTALMAVLAIVAAFSVLMFFGTVTGAMAMIFIIDFEVLDGYIGRCT